MSKFQSVTIAVDRMSDAEVVEAIKVVGEKASSLSVKMAFSGETERLQFSEIGSRLSHLTAINGIVLDEATFELPIAVTVTFHRYFSRNRPAEVPQFCDGVTISPANDRAIPHEVANVFSAVRQAFRPVDREPVIPRLDALGIAENQQRREGLDELMRAQALFTKDLQQFAVKTAHDIEQVRADAAKKVEDETARLQKLYDDRVAKLEEDRNAFEEKVKQFDLRDSTAVRRDIRDKLKTVLGTQTAALEKAAHLSRWPVFVAYIVLLSGIGVGAWYAWQQQIDGTSALSTWLLARQVTLTLSFVVTAGFFVKWLSNWAGRHADADFQIDRFALDFDRASYVVEWALEWAKDGREVPPLLIERLSRNLFSFESQEPAPATAADALASVLLGTAATAKVKIGENELTLDRNSVKQLKKALAGQAE